MAKKIHLAIALSVFLVILLYSNSNGYGRSGNMFASVFLMAYLWVTDAIPIAITALLPVILFPILGISKAQDIASEYFNSTILIFLGGFLLALTMEKWNLHKRIALRILDFTGSSPSRIVLGFMLATALISAILSNVATTTMMLPIALAICSNLLSNRNGKDEINFSKATMLAIAYASSIGGISTMIGTAPNLAFIGIMKETFPSFPQITFAKWLLFGIPLSIAMLILTWIVLTKLIFKLPASLGISKSAIKQDLIRLGIMHFEEKVIAIVLTLTGALWLFRSNIEFGSFTIPGWSQLMPFPKFLDDSTVAISMAFLLFLIPSKTKGTQIAEIKLFTKVPWDIIILFGGGFALAMGFEVSGLSRSIGELFAGINFNNPLILIVIICTILTFLTELTSNTATTYTVLPILASISIGIGINPIILMLPATLSASFAFMLPVATPPNAIVFSAGYLNIKDMVRAGFVLNLVGIIVITFVLYFISFPILGIKF